MIHCSLLAKVRLPRTAVFAPGHAGAHEPLPSVAATKHAAPERWSFALSAGQGPYVQLPSSVFALGSKFDAAESVHPAPGCTWASVPHSAAVSIPTSRDSPVHLISLRLPGPAAWLVPARDVQEAALRSA